MKKLSLLIVSLFVVLSVFACKSEPKEVTKIEDLFGYYLTDSDDYNVYFLKYKGSDSKYVGVIITASPLDFQYGSNTKGDYYFLEKLSNGYGWDNYTKLKFSKNSSEIITLANINFNGDFSPFKISSRKKIDSKTLKKITSQLDWNEPFGDINFH
jgi:hypothetical protein